MLMKIIPTWPILTLGQVGIIFLIVSLSYVLITLLCFSFGNSVGD